eukprot:765960-Hanusia_phi.AAC.1
MAVASSIALAAALNDEDEEGSFQVLLPLNWCYGDSKVICGGNVSEDRLSYRHSWLSNFRRSDSMHEISFHPLHTSNVGAIGQEQSFALPESSMKAIRAAGSVMMFGDFSPHLFHPTYRDVVVEHFKLPLRYPALLVPPSLLRGLPEPFVRLARIYQEEYSARKSLFSFPTCVVVIESEYGQSVLHAFFERSISDRHNWHFIIFCPPSQSSRFCLNVRMSRSRMSRSRRAGAEAGAGAGDGSGGIRRGRRCERRRSRRKKQVIVVGKDYDTLVDILPSVTFVEDYTQSSALSFMLQADGILVLDSLSWWAAYMHGPVETAACKRPVRISCRREFSSIAPGWRTGKFSMRNT